MRNVDLVKIRRVRKSRSGPDRAEKSDFKSMPNHKRRALREEEAPPEKHIEKERPACRFMGG